MRIGRQLKQHISTELLLSLLITFIILRLTCESMVQKRAHLVAVYAFINFMLAHLLDVPYDFFRGPWK